MNLAINFWKSFPILLAIFLAIFLNEFTYRNELSDLHLVQSCQECAPFFYTYLALCKGLWTGITKKEFSQNFARSDDFFFKML